MRVISKFILNRNDEVYYYVEKSVENKMFRKKTDDTIIQIVYTVHEDTKTKSLYNQENFHAIFGADQKISIHKFTKDAAPFLLNVINQDNKMEEGYNNLMAVSHKASLSNRLNPKIDTKTLISALEVYNTVLENAEKFEMDHTEEYYFIEGHRKIMNIKKHEEQNNNITDNEYTNEKEETKKEKAMERVKKYDK